MNSYSKKHRKILNLLYRQRRFRFDFDDSLEFGVYIDDWIKTGASDDKIRKEFFDLENEIIGFRRKNNIKFNYYPPLDKFIGPKQPADKQKRYDNSLIDLLI